MPIFEYQCKACCQQFEQLVFSSDTNPPVCPACNCGDVEKLMSAGSGGFKPPPCKPSAGG